MLGYPDVGFICYNDYRFHHRFIHHFHSITIICVVIIIKDAM